jgi:predicted transcriptional regulator
MDNTQNYITFQFAINTISMSQFIIETRFNLDNPNFKRVIEIAEEIISENQVLTLNKLYKRAKQYLKIPSPALKSIIQYLVNKKIIVDQSRFTRVSVLSNPYRKKIYSIVSSNPGVHLSAVKKLFQKNIANIGVGQLLWHIDMLIKFDFIKTIKIGNFLILLPIELDNDYGRICFFFRDDLNRRILILLNTKGQLKRSEIYKKLNESREIVYYHIKNLIEHELLLISDNSIIKIHPDKVKTLDLVIQRGEIIS